MTHNLRRIICNILILLLCSFGLPQVMKAQLFQASLSHYSTEDGLPSNAIASLRYDDYGYVWITTWNGISRFDGYDFYNYRTGNASGIRGLHNRVDDIIVDQAQNIWLKMYDGRMFVINRKTDRIEDPLEGVGGHATYHVGYFFKPFVTATNDVLVFYDNIGLYKFRLDHNGLKQDLILTGTLTVNCIVEGYRDDLWVGTNEGVHRIDMANMALEKKGVFLDEHVTRLTTNGYNIFAGTKSGKIMQFSYGQEPKLIKDVGDEITGLYIDSHGILWYSDLNDGAYRLNPKTGDTKFFKQRVLVPEFTSRGAEFVEALGVVWIMMNHGGYGYYNRETDEVEYFHNDPSNPWNLSNSVNAHLEMNDGVVWESTNRRGLEKLEILKNTITRTLLVPETDFPMDNETRALCYDKNRKLTFICNKRGCIFIYDNNGNLVGTITHDSNGKPISRPYGMSMDSKGNYWVCDKDNGIYKITPNGDGYTVINICHDEKDPWSLSANSAYMAIEDHEGNIWVATYGGGINILKTNKAGKYIALHSKNALKRYPTDTHQKVRTIAVAKDGKIWAGTTDGILIMSYHNNRVSVEPMRETDDLEKGLMSNDIICLACDKTGSMWVGTNSGGLSHTIEQDVNGAWIFENFGIKEGLPSEEIRSITFDEKGNAWIATDHILCSFDIKKKIFTAFSQLDGVDDTQCSEGATILAGNGLILFGTLNGYYTVDRTKLTTKKGSLLKLKITDFFLNGEIQSPRLNNTYNYYVPESKQVAIPTHDATFAFRFAALNYQLQHRVHYQYILEGYDEDWQNADKTRMASYTDIPAGEYTFKVKAFLLESPDNYDMRTIVVIVPHNPLFSPLAWFIYLVLIALASAIGFYFYRKKEKAKENQDDVISLENDDTEETEIPKNEDSTVDEYEIIED